MARRPEIVERNTKMRELRSQRVPVKVIAEQFGVQPHVVYQALHEEGIRAARLRGAENIRKQHAALFRNSWSQFAPHQTWTPKDQWLQIVREERNRR